MTDIILDFSGVPDTNPYVPSAPWEDAYGTGQVVSGSWRFATGDLGNAGLWNTDIPVVSSGLIHLKVSTKVVDNSAFGVYIVNSDGDGYVLRVRSGDGVQIFNSVSWDTPTQLGASEIVPEYNVDDVFDFYRDCDTGDMWIELDGVELIRRNSLTVSENLRGALYSRGGRMGLVTYVDTLSLNVSINDGTITSGSTGNTLTTTGNFTPTSGTIGGLPVSNITGTYPDFTFNLPEAGDGDDHPFIGTVTASFTDGVDTVTTAVELLPKTGYDVVTLSGDLDTTINGVVYQFVPEAQENDQILFPTPQVEINSNGSGSTTESGTFVLYHISSVDNKIRVFNLIVGDAEEPDPEPEVPIISNSNISLAGGMFSKMSIANLVNSRGKLPYIADSEASTVEEFVADLNTLISAMRTANWFEEEPE